MKPPCQFAFCSSRTIGSRGRHSAADGILPVSPSATAAYIRRNFSKSFALNSPSLSRSERQGTMDSAERTTPESITDSAFTAFNCSPPEFMSKDAAYLCLQGQQLRYQVKKLRHVLNKVAVVLALAAAELELDCEKATSCFSGDDRCVP